MAKKDKKSMDNDVKKLRYQYLKSVATVAASIVALITAIYTNVISVDNSKNINENAEQIKELKSLYDVADSLSATFTIDYPKKDQQISDTMFKVEGTWDCNMSVLQKNNLWVFAPQDRLYFPAQGIVSVTAKKDWSVNMMLSIKGSFSLLVVLADLKDSDWIKTWLKYTNGLGLEDLPEDVIILDKVDIERI